MKEVHVLAQTEELIYSSNITSGNSISLVIIVTWLAL